MSRDSTPEAVDVSLILTAHREGMLVGVSARSLLAARADAEASGLVCETIVVLDRADRLTTDILHGALGARARFFETDLGDPGMARNTGIEQARGRFSTFLDGDDLWGRNWVATAVAQARERPDAVAQSACNVFFGTQNGIWWHADSESELCDPRYLNWMNYWDAMCLAETGLFRRFPFRRNSLADGYGHEDWHWNILTLRAGVPHKPVPGTVHFKRRRAGTQSDIVDKCCGMPFPDPPADFDGSAFDRLLERTRPHE